MHLVVDDPLVEEGALVRVGQVGAHLAFEEGGHLLLGRLSRHRRALHPQQHVRVRRTTLNTN